MICICFCSSIYSTHNFSFLLCDKPQPWQWTGHLAITDKILGPSGTCLHALEDIHIHCKMNTILCNNIIVVRMCDNIYFYPICVYRHIIYSHNYHLINMLMTMYNNINNIVYCTASTQTIGVCKLYCSYYSNN